MTSRQTSPHRLNKAYISTQIEFFVLNEPEFNQIEVVKEATIEFIAGVTDSIVTNVYFLLSWYIFYVNHINSYFKSPKHIYYIFYFFNMNYIGPYFWGKTFRNSLSYLYEKGSKNNKFHILIVIFVQYISILIGLYLSIWFIEIVYSEQNAKDLKDIFVGKKDKFDGSFPYKHDMGSISIFLIKTVSFQLIDRVINRLSKNEKFWQSIYRVFMAHCLITDESMFIIYNPNYAFLNNMYYQRWDVYDMFILFIPEIVYFVWNQIFGDIDFSRFENPKKTDDKLKKQ